MWSSNVLEGDEQRHNEAERTELGWNNAQSEVECYE